MRSDLYENMMRAESVAIQFRSAAEAEDYVLSNPESIATVVKNCIVVSTLYGADYEFKK